MKTKLLLCVIAFFSFAFATHAQQANNRLWGIWELQSAKQTTFQNGENRGTTNLQKADFNESRCPSASGFIPASLFFRQQGEKKNNNY